MREDVSSNDNIKPQLHQTSNLHTTKGHNNIESVVNSEHTVVEFRSDTVDLHPTARIALVPLPAQDQDNQTREASNITVISRSGPDQNADVVTRMSNTSRVNALEPPLPGDFIGKRDSGLASINLESTQPCNLPTQKVTSNGVRASILENYRQSSTESKGSDTGNMSDTGSATFLPPTAAQETYKASSPSIIDARSFTNKSIGDRSLAAPSTISPEDEVLSLRVRSLYDSNTTKDSSSHVFTEPGQRRVSSIIEEGSVILAQECLTGNDKSEDKSTEGNIWNLT
ncbi:hypothetical protein EDC01DRAFT_36596 [Geopyxis carbonaria]|nr:hypothetical protein EDC01DRAFT_36596 [Geopyxis carbonaria]